MKGARGRSALRRIEQDQHLSVTQMSERETSDEERLGAKQGKSVTPGYYLISSTPADDLKETTLLGLWEIVWRQWLLVVSIGAIFAIGSVVVALLLTPIYRSEAMLAPATPEGAQSVVERLSGLASLAGINLGSDNKSNTAVATLRSRAFAASFIRDHNLMSVIFEDDWDAAKGRWKSDDPEEQPKLSDAVKYFRESIFSVTEDPTMGLVTIAIEWRNPDTAAQWVNELVVRINRTTRERALQESKKNLAYLRAELDRASTVELQRVIASLIENEMNTEMLAQAREDYAFTVIDPGVPPSERARPRRVLIVLTTTMLGGVLAVLIAFIRHNVRQELQSRKPS